MKATVKIITTYSECISAINSSQFHLESVSLIQQMEDLQCY